MTPPVDRSATEEWPVGEEVAGRYTIVGGPIGAGASGVVYPGVDAEGQPVAIKRLHRSVTREPDRFARLQRELGRAHQLRHPHILPVRGLVAHGRDTALVTALRDGGVVSQQEALGPEVAIALGIQVAQALVTAHRQGVLHGDVRPGNVLLGPAGASLFDFGLAGMARIGELRPGETPPEVLDGAPPTARSDLYGIGLVMYRLATGRDAFAGPTAWARIGRQREGHLATDALPLGLATCLGWLLHPDPLRRPTSAVTVIRMLRLVQRRPDRKARLPRRHIAPVRLRRGWSVHGVDPLTSASALLRTDLTRTEARRLARRLAGEGWKVRAERTALGPFDVALTVAAGGVGWFVVPVVGAPLFAYLALRWRSSRTRHELPSALPAVTAPLPPRRLPAGGEVAITVGLLLILSAVLLVVWPMAALFSLLLAAVLISQAWARRVDSASEVARRARIDNAFVLARRDLRALEQRDLPLDHLLGRLGALDALEASWRGGDIDDDAVLLSLEAAPAAESEARSQTTIHADAAAPGRPPG